MPRPPSLGQEANRARRRYLKTKKKPRGQGQVGPDGPRYRGPGFGKLEDKGRGLKGTRKQRENPRPKRGVTFGQRPNRPNRPNRRPRRPAPVDPFRSEVDALAELQYGGQQRELEAQRRITGQQQANVGNWYQQYQQAVQQAAAQQAAYTAGLQAAAYQQANTAAGADQAQNASLLAQQQQQAAQRGMTVDPSVAQNMQAGQAARQVQGTQFGGLLAAQGQAQGAYLGNRVGVAAQQGIQAQQDQVLKRQKIDQLAQELQREMGAFKVKARGEIQERQHTQRLENKAFGLDVAEFQQGAADDAADNAREDRKLRAQNKLAKAKLKSDKWKVRHEAGLDRLADLSDDGLRNFSKTNSPSDTPAGGRGSSGGGSGSGGSFTPTQVRSGRKALRNLVGRVKQNVDPPDSVDPLLARAAVQIADDGGVSPELARKIRRQYGFTPKIKRKSWQKKTADKGREAVQELF